MELLYLIAMATVGPFRAMLTAALLLPVALLGMFAGYRFWGVGGSAQRRKTVASVVLILTLAWGVVLEIQWPMRTGYETVLASRRGEISHQRAHQEIDLNGTPEGLVVRGLVFWGPFALALGLWGGAWVRRKQLLQRS